MGKARIFKPDAFSTGVMLEARNKSQAISKDRNLKIIEQDLSRILRFTRSILYEPFEKGLYSFLNSFDRWVSF